MEIGEKVLYWRDKHPLLEGECYPAVVLGIDALGEPKTAHLAVTNPSTGRKFNVIAAPISDSAEPGVCTAAKVLRFPLPKVVEPT
jgi:hypothetical protein